MHLRITLCQLSTVWEDKSANLSRIKQLIDDHDAGSDLIILPETFTTGFTMSAGALAESMKGPAVAWMREMAATWQSTVIGSIIVEQDKRYYNRLIVMPAEGSLQYYDKRHLFRMSGEQSHYSAGTGKLIFPINDWKIHPLICYDLRFPVWSRNRNNYDVLIYIANWPEARSDVWKALLKARAIENYCYVVGVNRTGTDGQGIRYCGESMAFDFKGRTLVNLGNKSDYIYTIGLDMKKQMEFREKFPVFLDADDFIIK